MDKSCLYFELVMDPTEMFCHLVGPAVGHFRLSLVHLRESRRLRIQASPITMHLVIIKFISIQTYEIPFFTSIVS